MGCVLLRLENQHFRIAFPTKCCIALVGNTQRPQTQNTAELNNMSCTSPLTSGPCLEIVQGTTFKTAFSVSGLDLTGAAVTLSFSGGYPKTLQYEASTASGEITLIITTPVTGQTIIVEIDEADTTTAFQSGSWVLTVAVGGNVTALVGGSYSFVRA